MTNDAHIEQRPKYQWRMVLLVDDTLGRSLRILWDDRAVQVRTPDGKEHAGTVHEIEPL